MSKNNRIKTEKFIPCKIGIMKKEQIKQKIIDFHKIAKLTI